MDKCPNCGAIGNRVKSAAHMYQCPKDGIYFDSKGQRYDWEVRGGFIKAKGDGDMTQKDKIKSLFNRETLLEELAKTSGAKLGKKLDVNSGQISIVCKEYEISQADIDRKRAELAEMQPAPKVITKPEIINNPTPEQVEKFFEDTKQPPADENKDTEADGADTKPEPDLTESDLTENKATEQTPPKEEITEQYYITEGEEKCSKGYPLVEALERIRTEYSVKQCENVHLAKETTILKEIPFIAYMAIAVME